MQHLQLDAINDVKVSLAGINDEKSLRRRNVLDSILNNKPHHYTVAWVPYAEGWMLQTWNLAERFGYELAVTVECDINDIPFQLALFANAVDDMLDATHPALIQVVEDEAPKASTNGMTTMNPTVTHDSKELVKLNRRFEKEKYSLVDAKGGIIKTKLVSPIDDETMHMARLYNI